MSQKNKKRTEREDEAGSNLDTLLDYFTGKCDLSSVDKCLFKLKLF